jgi:hypothetical protein
MTITLGSTTLCAGQTRNNTGDPVGPRDLRIQLTPGVAIREFVGADRVQPEHVKCDSGTISFGVTRTFATPDDAITYATSTFLNEPNEGVLTVGTTKIFGTHTLSDNTTEVDAKCVVTQRTLAVVGCTVAVNYSITG